MKINTETLDRLRADVGSEDLQLIIAQFREEIESRRLAIDEDLGGAQLDLLAGHAHSLCSTARTVGLDALADHAARLERLARAQERAPTMQLANELLVLCEDAATTLGDMLNRAG